MRMKVIQMITLIIIIIQKKQKTIHTNTENNNESSGSTGVSKIPSLNQRTKCRPNTRSCDDGYSCIRFNSDGESNYTCVKTELAFCNSGQDCKDKIGSNYEYCYVPPWSDNNLKQCFTKQVSGSHCLYDIHCVNNLSCVDKVCVSTSLGGDLEQDVTPTGNGYDFNKGNNKNDTILGINKWIFISAVTFPVIVLILCLWCWLIGRSSSKRIENKKREKYEKELNDLNIPQHKKDKKDSTTSNKNGSDVSTPTVKTYVNPQKEIEEEVGKRGFKSLFNKKKNGEDIEDKKNSSNLELDISSSKVDENTSDTPTKLKSPTLVNLNDKNGARTRKNAGMKSPSTPSSSVASFGTTSTQGKQRKKANGANAAGKKAKKAPSNNDTSNSTSSKQSSQKGLVNNAANMSTALSNQSTSYYNSSVSSLDPQSALYYQQMYAAQAAAAAQNPYYASYMQNPYYAAAAAQAAAAQNAAFYSQDPNAAAAQAAAAQNAAYYAQDPNAAAAAAAMYNYQAQQQGFQ